jgi:hypothetical protein
MGEVMNQRISWIADVDSSRVSVFRIIQTMSSRKPGVYLLGKGKSDGNPYVVGIYFADTVLSEDGPKQSHIAGYFDNICN